MTMKTGWVLAVAILVGLALGVLGTSTFAPAPADAAAAQFSGTRAMADVARIAARPHPTGSAEDAAVRAYLTQRLEALGLTVTDQVSALSEPGRKAYAQWSGNDGPAPPVTSLVATLPGRDRTLPAVLLMAHHDTVWGSPGAADDTTGVAAILETIRALKQEGQPARDVIVLFTDGEELGLNGARAFFADNPLRRRVGAIVNLESRGGGGRATLFETSRNNGAAVRRYIDAAQRPAGSSLSVFVYKLLPNDTDLTEALPGDYVAYNFAFIGRPGLYHSPLATPDRLDQGTLQDIGEQVLALTRDLASARPLPAPAPDLVFFDAFGIAMVHYPAWAGWLLLTVGAIGVGIAAWRGSGGDPRGWRALDGAVRMIALLVAGALVLFGLNALSGAAGPVNYYDRLAALGRLEWVALAGLLACFAALFAGWRRDGRTFAAAALPLVAFAAVFQAAAPTAAYIAVVPLLLIGLAQFAVLVRSRWVLQLATAIAAALVTGYMVQLGHQLVQGVGDKMLFAATLPFLFAALSWLPLWPGMRRRTALTAAAALLAIGIAIALWVRLDPLASSVAVYSNTK